MKYIVKDIQSQNDIVTTTIEITFDCGEKKTVAIPHFRPESKEDIFLGIENRIISEEASHKAETKNKQLIATLTDTIEAEIEFKKEE